MKDYIHLRFTFRLPYKSIRIFILTFILIGIIAQPINQTSTIRSEQVILSSILYVGGSGAGNYSTIQDAIDNSNDGDTIYVFKGTYYEHLVVDKSVTFIGESQKETIVHGSNSGDKPCFSVLKDAVEINNFTIVWTDWEYHEPGIRIYSDNVIVKNCFISNHDKGIILYRTSNNCTIENNIFYNVFEGLYLWPAGSYYHKIINNSIINCSFGIKLFSSKYNQIQNNIIDNAGGAALLIEDSNENIFMYNTIQNSSRGILLTQESKNNLIYNNNLIDNIDQVASDGINIWDNGEHYGGNYWADYVGEDNNNDGYGDIPYLINNKNQDNFPGMKKDFWKFSNPFSILLQCPTEGIVNQNIQFQIILNGGISPFIYHWDFGDNKTSTESNTTHLYENPGDYTVTISVTDETNKTISSSTTLHIYPEDKTSPIITIISPKPGLYVNNNHLFEITIPFVFAIGPLNIEIIVEDEETRITRLDVIIDDVKYSSTKEFYFYYCIDTSIGFYPIQVEAEDFAGNYAKYKLNLFLI